MKDRFLTNDFFLRYCSIQVPLQSILLETCRSVVCSILICALSRTMLSFSYFHPPQTSQKSTRPISQLRSPLAAASPDTHEPQRRLVIVANVIPKADLVHGSRRKICHGLMASTMRFACPVVTGSEKYCWLWSDRIGICFREFHMMLF